MGTKDNDELKDGEKVRVPMLMMDSQTAYSHRPGYRVSAKMLTDHKARETLADAYEDYETSLTNAWRNASTPEAPLLDSEWNDEDPYEAYDRHIQDAWRTK